MKKFISYILVLFAALSALSAADISVAALRGPTSMGLVSLMNESEKGSVNGNSYTFQIEGAADAVVPLIVRGDVDVAAIPGNLASVLYNNTKGKIEVIAINTL